MRLFNDESSFSKSKHLAAKRKQHAQNLMFQSWSRMNDKSLDTPSVH